MKSISDLDRLLTTLEVAVEDFRLRTIASAARMAPVPLNSVVVIWLPEGAIDLCSSNCPKRTCPKGSLILIPPRFPFELANCSGSDTVRIAIGTAVARLAGSFGLLDRAAVPIVEDLSDSQFIRQTCVEMLREGNSAAQSLGSGALASVHMKACILTVLRRFFRRPGIDQKIISALADPKLAGAVASILEAPGAPHSIARLAAGAGLSRTSFARLFAEALGQSPMEFVGRARLHKAAALLRSSRMPVKAVAAEVGYTSRSHFSFAFRAGYGADPSAYREEHSRELPAPPLRQLSQV